jgi:hypothetical protein
MARSPLHLSAVTRTADDEIIGWAFSFLAYSSSCVLDLKVVCARLGRDKMTPSVLIPPSTSTQFSPSPSLICLPHALCCTRRSLLIRVLVERMDSKYTRYDYSVILTYRSDAPFLLVGTRMLSYRFASSRFIFHFAFIHFDYLFSG